MERISGSRNESIRMGIGPMSNYSICLNTDRIIGNNFLIGQESLGHLVRTVEVKGRSLASLLKRWEKQVKREGALREGFLYLTPMLFA